MPARPLGPTPEKVGGQRQLQSLFDDELDVVLNALCGNLKGTPRPMLVRGTVGPALNRRVPDYAAANFDRPRQGGWVLTSWHVPQPQGDYDRKWHGRYYGMFF
jgi:hypothetical protein